MSNRQPINIIRASLDPSTLLQQLKDALQDARQLEGQQRELAIDMIERLIEDVTPNAEIADLLKEVTQELSAIQNEAKNPIGFDKSEVEDQNSSGRRSWTGFTPPMD